MVCPYCGSKDTDVYNSRHSAKSNSTWRRRRCLDCQKTFTTYESIDPSSVLRVYSGKKTTPYSRDQIVTSLMKVLEHRPDTGQAVGYLTNNIEQKLYRYAAEQSVQALPKQLIISIVSETLAHFDPVAYVKYASHYQNLDAKDIGKALKNKA